jgi:hypothetical protein
MKTRSELLELRQNQCEWKKQGYCPITEFDKCKACKAIHSKPLGLEALVEGGWKGIQAIQRGVK